MSTRRSLLNYFLINAPLKDAFIIELTLISQWKYVYLESQSVGGLEVIGNPSLKIINSMVSEEQDIKSLFCHFFLLYD